MKNIIFSNLEVNKKIKELGLIYKDDNLKTTSIEESCSFINSFDYKYIAEHNFIDFD